MTSSSPPDRSAIAPLAALAVGAIATMAALAAAIVAGLAGADLYPASNALDAARDRGVWMATQAWATPLALAGLGVIFGVAIPLALRNVIAAIDQRRNAMVASLPTLIKGANQ